MLLLSISTNLDLMQERRNNMFNTLESYHFKKLPQSIKDKAEKMIDDICSLGILNEGTIDAVEVWGRDDILLLMQAMYNEARKEE